MSNHKMTITAIMAVIAIAATVIATVGVVHAQVASNALDSTENEVEISVDSMNQITKQIVSTQISTSFSVESSALDATDCQSHTNTSVYVTVDGNFFGSSSTTNDYKKFTFSGNIDVGDKVIVSVTYTT